MRGDKTGAQEEFNPLSSTDTPSIKHTPAPSHININLCTTSLFTSAPTIDMYGFQQEHYTITKEEKAKHIWRDKANRRTNSDITQTR